LDTNENDFRLYPLDVKKPAIGEVAKDGEKETKDDTIETKDIKEPSNQKINTK
jgi:hypothetical protein